MIIPICCFTCGKQIAHLWERYIEALSSEYNERHNIKIDSTNKVNKNLNTIEKRTLDKFKLRRYCCRRMLLTNVDLCKKI